MRPASRKSTPSENHYQPTVLESNSTIGSIKGVVKKLGQNYKSAILVVYDKVNLHPIAAKKPQLNGGYVFNGIPASTKTFIVALDRNQQFNAVIQDNVVPK